MKFKSLAILLIISSFFLTCILSIWKIMATLQGLSFTNLNVTPVFLIGILLSLAFVLIGNKVNHASREDILNKFRDAKRAQGRRRRWFDD